MMFRRRDPIVLRRLAALEEEQPNARDFEPQHCSCLPCRHGLPGQHVRRTDQLVGARP